MRSAEEGQRHLQQGEQGHQQDDQAGVYEEPETERRHFQ
jgi:hypothetical protein